MTESKPAAISAGNFLLNFPLYRDVDAKEQQQLVRDLREGRVQFDCHCCECGRQSTFKTIADVLRKPPVSVSSMRPGEAIRPPAFFSIRLLCARASHVHQYHLWEIAGRLQKIGQLPSYGDIIIGEMAAEAKALDPADRRELNKALRLFSSDIFIGAFVYLRRVFERVVGTAADLAIKAGVEPESLKIPMAERIVALKDYLPEAVSKNAVVWKILSRGVHELSEEDCQAIFPVMQAAIMQMLEQESHRQKARRAEVELERALQGIAGKM
ncbi:MAG: hypothetical protein EON59_03200 [Alphaproteobacteria bacterium]|nr:MAG: hypothetical protein EON59_03200 [Alphaproteobacteria bacterium]